MRWLRVPHLRPAAVFFALLLVPSLLLGWFSLRAVESERAGARLRLLADQQRYALFAGRAVHTELATLEALWESLLPRSVGWETRLDEVRAALDAAKGRAFVRGCHLLHVSGRRLYPSDGSASEPPAAELAALKPAEAARIRELLAAAEAAEFDSGDTAAALRAYQRIRGESASENLRAIALAGIARLHLRQGDAGAARREYGEILRLHPDARDLDNQPLRVHAQLGIAGALEAQGDPFEAARTLTALYEDLLGRSDEIGSLQFEILVDRIQRRMAKLVPQPVPVSWTELQRRFSAVRAQPKRETGSIYFVHKLSRKLLRASLDGLPYSTSARYLSETTDGKPFLLAYLYLPDTHGTGVSGIVGFDIDLQLLSRDLLPDILRRVEPAAGITLAVVDESGHALIGSDAEAAPVATASLGVPFNFWSVAVFRASAGAEDGPEFRTKVYLYLVWLLLVTIVAGAVLGVAALRQEARLANLKTSFASRVSHELRTPLTSIRLYTEMLEMGGEKTSPEERARSLGTIRRECERLERLIDQVLDFTRIERGVKQYRFEYEEIGALVGNVAEEFRTQAEADGCRYEVEIEPDLPELRVDADAVRQMLLNLLSNAVKYSDDDRSIAVRAFRRGSEVALEVEDHGIGVDGREQERIFEEFYRVETALSSWRSGVGLGLTLVRRLAEAHGGRIGVESRRGQGSRFTIWLPLPAAAAEHARAAGGGVAEARGG